MGSIAALSVGLSNSSAFTILIYGLAFVRHLVHSRATWATFPLNAGTALNRRAATQAILEYNTMSQKNRL